MVWNKFNDGMEWFQWWYPLFLFRVDSIRKYKVTELQSYRVTKLQIR